MKMLLTPHSMVDVITNSSSEIFICNTQKILSTVRQILVELLDLYNSQFNASLRFDEVFKAYYLDSKEEIKESLDYLDYYCNNTLDKVLKIQEEKGKVLLIESASDNSIPHALWQWMEDLFAADRIHLG